MSTTARIPLMPRKSKTTTPISMVTSTDPTGVATSISILGPGRFSNLMRSLVLPCRDTCGSSRLAVDAAHQKADFLDVHPNDGHRHREPALIDDRERVAERKELVQILADHDNGRPRGGKIDQRLMDGRRGPGIH